MDRGQNQNQESSRTKADSSSAGLQENVKLLKTSTCTYKWSTHLHQSGLWSRGGRLGVFNTLKSKAKTQWHRHRVNIGT
ncbi:uncharacterized protein LOC133422209 isoform X3 [Cololabis saira]|uniref:uncharacterized protein LOC133422209 isoform X3 n=1 Tax=Cololabis saira TaxID=129043 RepID=UPI002AD53905|nr:uncharacterized protein LOC133422209 isoform X3 [Cololabis saira]